MKKTPKILIAEDDLDDQLLLKSAFKENQSPCQVTFVADGEQLLTHLKENTLPDLILLDLNMPKIDGREVLKQIRFDTNLSHIPVLIISTSSAEGEIKMAYTLGASAYLVKPTSYEKLLLLVKNLSAFYFETVALR
ncbi:MAG: two-component system response regulator [Algoriphagus sp.]|jgi:two-component system response regulator